MKSHTKLPSSEICMQVAHKIAYKIACDEQPVQSFGPYMFMHGLATKEGCRTRCKSRNIEYAMGVRSIRFTI
jgi:hypothetical protein